MVDCRGELSVGRMVKHGSEDRLAGVLLVEWGITKKACPTSAGKIMTPLMPTLHHHGMDCRGGIVDGKNGEAWQ